MLRLLASRHFAPVALLVALATLFWGKVLFSGQVLLPGAMLKGFAPFGSDAQAPWNILQWDALAQYYPWRVFAARELQSGVLPLWNPHQFSGAPFVANGQSAVFYPLHFPFWFSFGSFDVAWAFGFSAWLHTLLAAISTYALLQRWNRSRAASVLGAVAFGFCGYFASWIMLPTLANTASWLPLCVLFYERAVAKETTGENRFSLVGAFPLAASLACALLAGHVQIFFYILVALILRAFFLTHPLRAMTALLFSGVISFGLCAIQILPTLELARLGHRAGSKATIEGWNFLVPRALQIADFPSLFIPSWPQLSFSENFGYVGIGVLLLSLFALIFAFRQKSKSENQSPLRFAFVLALFGILYATATPLSQAFYFFVPGLSQMGGVGRALVLWSFGVALLAAFGLDALRSNLSGKGSTPFIPIFALFVIGGELFANGLGTIPTSARNAIYPQKQLTQFLQFNSSSGARVLFLTPRNSWLPEEILQENGRNHPEGVLPPNGAMAFGIYDVNGYDSLAPRAYREFLIGGEGADVSPPLNGNMILLNNPNSPALDALSVRYVVSENPLEGQNLKEVLREDGAIVYERELKNVPRRDGKDFSPGWRDGKYQPQSFRLGAFLSLLTLGFIAALVCAQSNFPFSRSS